MDDPSNPVARQVREQGLEAAFLFCGETGRAQEWIPAFDALVSSSYTEGFPNVIGEAMACGVPCVVTDVGDSALLLGDAGLVVRPRDPAELARALEQVIRAGEEGRAAWGARGRDRILRNFSIGAVARRYMDFYCVSASAASR